MAAVSLFPTPANIGDMPNKRIPLGNVPNAANSPFRAVAAAASKRSRDQVDAEGDSQYESKARVKRQALEADRLSLHTPPKKQTLQSIESRSFSKRINNTQPTDFERKLLAAKRNDLQEKVEKKDKASHEALDDIQKWHKFYTKSFPSFIFYFESVSEELRIKYSKWVRAFGAREEKFFSKEVTHVVTSRELPGDHDAKNTKDAVPAVSKSASSSFANSTRTINPSLLDRQPDFQAQPSQSRTKSALEPVASRRAINSSRDVEPQKISLSNADILSKAVEMGMKVWHLEKLQRILKSMVDMPNEAQAHVSYTSRMKIASTAVKGEREAELSRMIRHEQINGPSDRDATVALSELIPFKGPHIYIRDVNEKTKPIMVREYPKPPRGELGVWPQFRATSQGKCPFVEEDIPPTPEEIEKAIVKAREAEVRTQQDTETRIAPRTRATTTREDAQANNVMRAPQKRPLEETKNKANTAVAPAARMPTQEFCPPPPFIFGKCGSPSKSVRHTLANAGPRLCGGEPAASGLQPSNVTSAIRSQMISSTAAAPGTKSGTSREVHGLKRKVLEKNSGPALNGIQTRQRTLDPAGTARAERNIQISRPSRRQPQKTLIHVDEESTLSEEEDEEDVWMAEDVRAKQKQQKKVLDKKHQKPGYCENCREKYDDFDQHVVGKRHRKFALTQDNWRDLDKLLAQLGRQLKEPDSDGF